jgi:SagB-type dehydrogenase family enzyme
MALDALSYILQCSYGVTGNVDRTDGGGSIGLRASPSAGACYPAEVYVIARAVSSLPNGVYHYCVPDCCLEQIRDGDVTDEMHTACGLQSFPREAAAAIVISGVMARTLSKYQERGYRYILLDIGHLGQNIYLTATAKGLAVVSCGGFFDDQLAELLQFKGTSEQPFYVLFVGVRSDSESQQGIEDH